MDSMKKTIRFIVFIVPSNHRVIVNAVRPVSVFSTQAIPK